MKQKKHFPRLFASCLTILMLLTSLTSCGGAANNSESNSQGSPNNSADDSTQDSESPHNEFNYDGTAPVFEETRTFTILSTNGASLIQDLDNMTWWQEILNKANVELDIQLVDASAYSDVVQPRLAAASDLPDAIRLPNRDENMAYADSGIFIELSPYIEKYGINLSDQFEVNPNLKSQLTTPDGNIFYLPYIYTTSGNSRTVMFNTQYLDAVGMTGEDINNLDDLYDYLVAVKNTDANGNGNSDDEIPLFMRSGMIQLWGMFWGLDLADSGGFQVEDGTVISGFADERYLDMLTYMNKLYTEGLLYAEFPAADFDRQSALFSENAIGSILHFISNGTGYSSAINPDWDIDNDDPIMQAYIPMTGPYGDKHVYGRDILGAFYGITRDAKDPDGLFAFFDYIYSKEAGELAWFGIEGTDYNMSGDEMVFTETYIANEDNYRGVSGYNFDGLVGYQHPGGYLVNQSQSFKEISIQLDDYVLNPSVTFAFMKSEENAILQSYLADLKTFFTENLVAFITGTRPLDQWTDYLSELEAMNINQVISVYQNAIDRQSN